MGRKSKYTIEEKVQAVLDYKNGKRGVAQICNDLNMNHSNLVDWISIYDKYGESGFVYRDRNKSYIKEFKEMVVREYLNGNSSTRDLCIKYEIPSHQTLLKWVNSYNGHEELKDYNPKGDVYMTKRRKTTLEERNEIVQYCLEHNKEYKLAAEHFDVSYAQVYQWVQKYLKSGEDGLIDNRGKRKDESQLSELERLRRENERLKRQLELKEREEIILKKLQEVERRRYSPKGNRNRSI